MTSNLMIVRGFKNPKTKLKSRRTAVKRFIETGNGKLKRARCGKVISFNLRQLIHLGTFDWPYASS